MYRRKKHEQRNTKRSSKKCIRTNERSNGLWQPKGLGLSYVKGGGQTVILISQENIPTSADARVRMRMLIERIGWTVDDYVKSLMWNI